MDHAPPVSSGKSRGVACIPMTKIASTALSEGKRLVTVVDGSENVTPLKGWLSAKRLYNRFANFFSDTRLYQSRLNSEALGAPNYEPYDPAFIQGPDVGVLCFDVPHFVPEGKCVEQAKRRKHVPPTRTSAVILNQLLTRDEMDMDFRAVLECDTTRRVAIAFIVKRVVETLNERSARLKSGFRLIVFGHCTPGLDDDSAIVFTPPSTEPSVLENFCSIGEGDLQYFAAADLLGPDVLQIVSRDTDAIYHSIIFANITPSCRVVLVRHNGVFDMTETYKKIGIDAANAVGSLMLAGNDYIPAIYRVTQRKVYEIYRSRPVRFFEIRNCAEPKKDSIVKTQTGFELYRGRRLIIIHTNAISNFYEKLGVSTAQARKRADLATYSLALSLQLGLRNPLEIVRGDVPLGYRRLGAKLCWDI